jgi:flagellar biosynthesis/type III secretory pathway protein FliH
MPTRRNEPPSRLRYEAAHPTVAVHCDAETKARLVALREATDLSLGSLVKQALGVLERDVGAARSAGAAQGREAGRRSGLAEGRLAGREEGRQAGFAEARRRYRITYPCAKCGKDLDLTAGSEDAKAARQALIDAEWAHDECP